MKLRVRDLNIVTGGPLIGILNEDDAKLMDIHVGDRIIVKRGDLFAHVIVDLTTAGKVAPQGSIVLVEEVLSRLQLSEGTEVNIELSSKPASLQYIKRKLDGQRLTPQEIAHIVSDIVEKKLSDIELTYFVAACYSHLLDLEETVALTKAMINTGEILKLRRKVVVDKHCIGGVAGNRTTPLIVPILAAAGLTVPKTSSRSITSPAGTADTVEVFCPVTFPIGKMKSIIEKTNACLVWGGAINLAPADDMIIRVEHPLSIDATSQLIASILAKKASVSSTHVLIDIPVGRGSKVEDKKHALFLKRRFELIGRKVGLKVYSILTDGSQPIGNGMGPALEARDILWVLKNSAKAPQDLRRKSLHMAGTMLELVRKCRKGQGLRIATEILTSGKAYAKFLQIIKEQGGSEIEPEDIKVGKFTHDIRSQKTGIVTHVDNGSIAKVARIAGAPNDSGAGIYLKVHKRDYVTTDDILYTIHSDSKERLSFAIDIQRHLKDIDIQPV